MVSMNNQLLWFKNWAECLNSQREDTFTLGELIERYMIEISETDLKMILVGTGCLKTTIRRSITDPKKVKTYLTVTRKGKKYGYNQRSIHHPIESTPRFTQVGFERLIKDFNLRGHHD